MDTNIQFFIRGVDYQPGGTSSVSQGADPLSEPEACARDIALFQKLNINVCIHSTPFGTHSNNRQFEYTTLTVMSTMMRA